MAKTLLLTDIHLRTFCPGYLEAQTNYLKQIVVEEKPDTIIVMGDIFMNRRPSPTVLLALDNLLADWEYSIESKDIWLLRGNHDSETKADDGITALSLWEDRHYIITSPYSTWIEGLGEVNFIPHYEYQNENLILEALRNTKPEAKVFGHFGFYGSMNSVGDKDFSISPNAFQNETYLGHIHTYNKVNNITVLGTQYSTNFGEALKPNYYGVFEDKEFTLKEATGGPRHIVAPASMLENEGFQDYVNDDRYFNMLRVQYNGLDTVSKKDIAVYLKEKFPLVKYSEVKFKPLVLNKGDISNYTPDDIVLSVDTELIKKYIEQNNTDLPTDKLLDSFQSIRDIDNAEYRQG